MGGETQCLGGITVYNKGLYTPVEKPTKPPKHMWEENVLWSDSTKVDIFGSLLQKLCLVQGPPKEQSEARFGAVFVHLAMRPFFTIWT